MSKKKYELSALQASHCINVGVFLVVIAIMGLAAVFLPKPNVSEYEKRELEQFPEFSLESLFSGEYTEKLDLFFADTFPAREKFVELAAGVEEARGLRIDDVKIHESTAPTTTVQPEPPKEEVVLEKPTETAPQPERPSEETPAATPNEEVKEETKEEAPPVAETDEVEGEQRGSVFIYKDMALPMFGGNKCACDRYAAALKKYQEALGDNVQIYNLVVPSSIEFYLPQKYKDKGITADEKENIDYIYAQMDPNIKTVDAYSSMMEAKEKGEYIYFRTDHHWTVRGAYAAYEAFCEEAGFEPVPLESMERHVIENFVGTLYGQTQDAVLRDNPDYVEYFVPPMETETYRYIKNQPYTPYASTIFADYATGGGNTYSVFLHGDLPLTHIKTKANTGRKIVVVKESFGNAFSPFMVSHYDEVFIVDQRYFQLGLIDFIQQNGVTDLLFINNIFAANTDIRINEIDRIKYQVFVPPVVEEVPEEDTEETTEDSSEKSTEDTEEKTSKKKAKKKKSDDDDEE
ncbi:MAG: hypothetical protein IJP15_06835 [Oscillospiraceae bacterium]|nr:hypothetical protein [Oscillospiraceae bacterium]